MKAATFATKVNSLKPNRSLLAGEGLPDEFIDELLSNYDIPLREKQQPFASELAALIHNYHIKGFELFGITFSGETYRKEGRLVFAHMELDELAVEEPDGPVQLLSFETGTPIYTCAADSEAFLDALYAMAELSTARMAGHPSPDPCLEAVRLAELAGLPQSADFYRWVLGCEGEAVPERDSAVRPRER